MVNNSTFEQSFLQRITKNSWVRVFIILVFLCAAFLFFLPHIIRIKLENWLIENGAQSADIQEVRLNLLTGTAGLDGLQVKLNDKVVLGDSNFNIDIQLASLFKKEIHLKTGKLAGLRLNIDKLNDGSWRVGSVTLPSSTTEKKKVEEKDISWLFRASHVELEDCLVKIAMPKIQKEILVEKAVFNNLISGISEQHGSVDLKGTINDTPLYLNLDKVRLNPTISTEGHIKVEGYNLGVLQQLLNEILDPFAGIVSLDGKVQFSQLTQGGIDAEFEGTIFADKVDIGNDSFSTPVSSASYNGKIQYQQNPDSGMLIDVKGLLQGEEIGVGVPAANLKLTEKHLLLDGATSVAVDNGVAVTSDASINLDNFYLGLPQMSVKHSGLKWQGHSEYILDGDLGTQSVLAKGEFIFLEPVYRLDSQDFSLHTQGEEISWQGDVNYLLGADKSNLLLEGSLTSSKLDLEIPEVLGLSEDTLSIAGKTEINIKPELQVAYDGGINLGPTEVATSGIKISGREIAWQGAAGYLLVPQTVSLNGKLVAKELGSLFEEQKIQVSQQDISTSYDNISLKIAEQMRFKGNASLQADKLQVSRAGSPMLSLEKATVASIAETTGGGVLVDNVTLSSISVPGTDAQPVAVSVPEVVLHSSSTTDFQNIIAESLEIRQPTVKDTKTNIILANLESITAHKINIDEQRSISLTTLSGDKGLFLRKEEDNEKSQLTFDTLQANQITWSDAKGLFCDQIELNSLFANYTRSKPTEADKKQPEKNPDPEPGPEQEEKEQKSGSMPLQINNITVTGNSGFRYVDKVPSVPFTTLLTLETFKVENINSWEPEVPFTFVLDGSWGKYSPFDASGSCSPFAEKFSLESKMRVRNYPLQYLSPYTIDSIGTLFTRGQLNLTAEYKINGDEFDLDNQFIFQQVETEAVKQDLHDAFNNKLPVSLNTAISMLEDKNGNVDLSVPVTGSRTDLHIDPTDMVITAFSKAIVVGVTPYLAYTFLGPTGAFAYLGLKAGQSLLKTNLPNLEFENGTSELTEDHKTKLDRAGKVIKKDKKSDYSICSRALIWELAGDIERTTPNQKKILEDLAARKALFVLAEKRAKNVQEYLAQNYSINKDRLLICAPTVNFEPDGKSLVMFLK